MYQRIEKDPADQAEKFELLPLDVNDAIALLQSWCGDEPLQQQEQRDTWEHLKKALDEDRIADRRLFP